MNYQPLKFWTRINIINQLFTSYFQEFKHRIGKGLQLLTSTLPLESDKLASGELTSAACRSISKQLRVQPILPSCPLWASSQGQEISESLIFCSDTNSRAHYNSIIHFLYSQKHRKQLGQKPWTQIPLTKKTPDLTHFLGEATVLAPR